MGGKKDAKVKFNKGKKTRKGGIVNQPEENSEHSDIEKVQEVDQQKSQEKEKTPREKTNEPTQKETQAEDEADDEGDNPLPDMQEEEEGDCSLD